MELPVASDGSGARGRFDEEEHAMGEFSGIRSDEVRDAVAMLRRGTGVVVRGVPGSGRTRVIREVLGQLDEDLRERVRPVADVAGLDPDRLEAMARSLRGEHALLLSKATSHRRLPDAVEDLLDDGLVEQVHLRALSGWALVSASEGMLRGPIAPEALLMFVARRGGSDLRVLREALESARAEGAIVPMDGEWRLAHPPALSRTVRELILSRGGIASEIDDPAAATIMDLVALSPGLPLATVGRIARDLDLPAVLETQIERLEEAGVLEVADQPGGPRLRLRDGVLEAILPRTMGVMRRRRLCRATADVLSTIPSAQLSAEELLALAQSALFLEREITGSTLTLAARASLRDADAALTQTLAHAAVERGGGFDAEMALAAAESQLGLTDEALSRLQGLVSRAEGDEQRGEALMALIRHVEQRPGDPSLAFDLHATVASTDETTQKRLTALRGVLVSMLGDAVGAAEMIEPAIDVLEGGERVHALLVVAGAALVQGRLDRARTALGEAEQAISAFGADISRVVSTLAYVDVFEARAGESLARARAAATAAETFGQWGPHALYRWTVGLVLLFMGRAPEAVTELTASLTAMDRLGISRTALLVRTDLATVLAISGHPAEALGVLEPALTAARTVFDLDAKALQALGWVHACAGRAPEAHEAFVRASDIYGAVGHHLASLSALVDAGRAGHARAVLVRVEALAPVVHGEYFALAVRLVRALAYTESVDMPEVEALKSAGEFGEIGNAASQVQFHLLAAEAYSRAADLFRLAGDDRRASALVRRRDGELEICGLERVQTVPAGIRIVLSARESEIARLAADGLPNKSIAEKLVLSVRTVETHLQRIYQKLGVRARTELAEALGGSRRPVS